MPIATSAGSISCLHSSFEEVFRPPVVSGTYKIDQLARIYVYTVWLEVAICTFCPWKRKTLHLPHGYALNSTDEKAVQSSDSKVKTVFKKPETKTFNMRQINYPKTH